MQTSHRKQQITLPSLSFKERTQAFVLILTEMHKSERVEKKDDNRKAATTCRVKNLEDGKDYIMICPALMVSSLQDIGEDYVGKCYEVNVTADKLPGKDYKGVEVYEIDPDVDYSKPLMPKEDAS